MGPTALQVISRFTGGLINDPGPGQPNPWLINGSVCVWSGMSRGHGTETSRDLRDARLSQIILFKIKGSNHQLVVTSWDKTLTLYCKTFHYHQQRAVKKIMDTLLVRPLILTQHHTDRVLLTKQFIENSCQILWVWQTAGRERGDMESKYVA